MSIQEQEQEGATYRSFKQHHIKSPSLSDPATLSAVMEDTRKLLAACGEDPDRQGLRDTPQRYAKAMQYLTCGYSQDPHKIVGNAIFEENTSEIILVRDIEVFSLCEHHLLPFFGKAHVAYIPNGKVIGLSKIPRIIEIFARRLQLQERLTSQIADALMEVLQPLGVAVVIEASHLCMMMRGVQKQHSSAVTSAMLGVFRTNPTTRKELLDLIGSPGRRE